MSRQPNRRRVTQRDAFPWGLAVLGALALGVVIGGFAWLFMTASARRVELADNLCPRMGATSQTVVLVDVSDSISAITKQDLLNRLHEAVMQVERGGLLEIRLLHAAPTSTETLFSICNPGDGADLDSLTGNPELARRRWEEGFRRPLEEALATSVSATEAATSPIMGAIQEIAVTRLSQAGIGGKTRLIVASDMLENTEDFSMYESGADFLTWKGTPAAIKYGTDLRGATVELWIIKRASTVPSAKAGEFWANWILDNGGVYVPAQALQGLE
jgi:hypothetical protein